MSWLRSAVNKAVEVGGKRKITRNLRSAVQTAGYAVVDGAKVVHDRSGPGNFKSFKHALKRLEEQSVSCRGIERLQQLRRWLVALKEIERLKEARVEQEKNNDPPEDISIAKKDLPREPTMVLYYDPDLGGEPMNFKDVFLRSQALEGIVLSVILEAPDEEEVSLLTEIFGIDSEVSNIQQDLNKMECWPPSVEVDKRSSELSTATITEALKDELSQLQLCSKLESLLSKEKIMLNRNSLENHFQKVDKLKVLSASLSCSASRAEEHISESRVQKDGAVSFRISKGNEFSQLEKELTFEIDELGKQKDQLEAELKRVNTALISAHVHLRNAKEERDQFNEASNEILQHFQLKEDELSRSVASYRAEADVCDAFIYFLEDTRGFESSYINQKQKHVNEELERCEGYFVELVIRVLSAYKDELGPSVLNLKKLAEDLRGSEIPAAAPNGGEKKSAVDARRRLEEEYLKAETKLITAFSVVESIKKQFYAQVEGISRKDDENVRELFDNLSKIKEELESMQRPSLEVETSNRRGADKSSSKVAPESTQSLNPISPGSIHQTERQKSVRENLRRSLSMAIRQANDSVSFSRDDSSFTSHKPLRTKNTDPAAELSKLKMELELENSSKDHPFDEIDDWESDVIVKNTEYGE
ncbi:PREDICTED: uncharacterized protein LOC109180091 isoform X2 [Ipomoea nil]|uniref:uncharacterized protein LOC109180091 isoform X2 n=1 Tax=Ipomoea nil TaxID=35883 RepID=UPI000901806C|nr:PREDICTED: uncharacterized protein LOC109180091 isoform X2 [Ipomoea nil]